MDHKSPSNHSKSPELSNKGTQANSTGSNRPTAKDPWTLNHFNGGASPPSRQFARNSSSDSLHSLSKDDSPQQSRYKRGVARSGSITEAIVDAGGVRKVVLQTNSSSDAEDGAGLGALGQRGRVSTVNEEVEEGEEAGLLKNGERSEEVWKKKKRKAKKKRPLPARGASSGSGR
jgi:metal transporter CNNM